MLTRLVGHIDAGAGDDDVVAPPDQVDQHGGDRAVSAEQSPDATDQPQQVEPEQHHVGKAHAPVEEVFVDHAALDGDIEPSEPGVDQRQQHRPQDVPGQHRLVDLVPEGMAKLALQPGIGGDAQQDVR